MSALRLIEGGRAAEGLPGLLDPGRGARSRRSPAACGGAPPRTSPRCSPAPGGDLAADGAPVIACWEGRILAVGPRADAGAGPRGGRLPAVAVRPPRRGRRHGHAGARGRRTRTCCSPASREGELVLRQRGAGYLEILAAGGGILSTVAATREASAEELEEHGRRWLGEMLAHGDDDGRGEVRLRPGPPDGAAAARGRPPARPARARSTSCRPGSGPTPSRPSTARGPDGTEAYVRHCIEEQLPGRRRPGPGALRATSSARRASSRADQSRRILEAAARLGLLPRLHADEIAPSGGAELAAEIGALSADHLAAPSRRGDRRARARGRGRAPGRSPRSCRRRPGSSCTTTSRRPGRLIERGRPGGARARTSIPAPRRRRACRS